MEDSATKPERVDEPQITDDAPDFRSELCELLNRHSIENRSDTPDWILRNFLCDALRAFDVAVCQRSDWYGTEVKARESKR